MASASAAARLCILACRSAPRVNQIPRTQRVVRQCVSAQRAFTTTRIRWAREAEPREEEDAEEEETGPVVLKKLDKAFVDGATVEEIQQLEQIAHESGFKNLEDYLQSELDSDYALNAEDRVLFDSILKIDKGAKPNKQSFWYDEEDPEMNTEEHDEFDEDDITSMAHGKLDQVREMRHYARLAVWEMPLLAKLAKPFTPPADGEVLRWRYTSYMGEFHPAEKKVVVQFHPDDLPNLTPVQKEKLKKLAGPRYNPESGIIKLSSDSYEHQAQNKAYLSNLVDDLVAAARDPTDTFEDIPLDLRHHKIQKKPKFPKEWLMTKDRRQELQDIRNQAALADKAKVDSGKLIEGAKVIDGFLLERAAREQEKLKEAELVAVSAPKASGGARARR